MLLGKEDSEVTLQGAQFTCFTVQMTLFTSKKKEDSEVTLEGTQFTCLFFFASTIDPALLAQKYLLY
jgi:hypothetical protein